MSCNASFDTNTSHGFESQRKSMVVAGSDLNSLLSSNKVSLLTREAAQRLIMWSINGSKKTCIERTDTLQQKRSLWDESPLNWIPV